MIDVAGRRVPRHGAQIVAIWAVLTAIAVPLVVLVLGPHLPPGKMSAEAADQTNANTVMTALMAPIVLMVVVYFAYSLVAFRSRGGGATRSSRARGAPAAARGHRRPTCRREARRRCRFR